MEQLKKLDKLPFTKWHLALVLVLGVSWVFDGYEVSSLSLCSSSIKQSLGIEDNQFFMISSFYLAGCALGGLTFGLLSFFIGRKSMFLTTLLIYALSILIIVLANGLPAILVSRMVAGFSIGGEYTAIFSAIDQFIPASYRGRVDIIIDGSWHFGGIVASLLSMGMNYEDLWKWMFALGLFGVIPLLVFRRYIPESPRWLFTKNRGNEAVSTIIMIQKASNDNEYFIQQRHDPGFIRLENQPSQNVSCQDMLIVFLRTIYKYPRRIFVAATLIFCQAFFFNSMYYKYPIVLAEKGIADNQVGKYMIQLSIASFLGPILIGRYFDTVGRRIMCLITFGISGVLLIILNSITPDLITLQIFMVVLFLISSPAASSANLTASQLFPTDSRCLILSCMFMLGMLGGLAGVWVKQLLASGILMIAAGLIGWLLGTNAQNRSLQQIQSTAH